MKNSGKSELLDKVIFLKKMTLFSSMRTLELRTLAAIAERFDFAAGGIVVSEGEVGDSMYLIESGSVSVLKNFGTEKETELAVLSSGEYFGEMALFDAELRSATVVAVTDCSLLNIRSDDLHDVLLEHPSIAIDLIRTFVRRLRNMSAGVGQ